MRFDRLGRKQRDIVLEDVRVSSNKPQAFFACLGNKQPIKWISVQQRQSIDGLGVSDRDRELEEAIVRQELGDMRRRSEFAQLAFDGDFESRDGAYEHLIRWIGNGNASFVGELSRVRRPVDEHTCVEEEASHSSSSASAP